MFVSRYFSSKLGFILTALFTSLGYSTTAIAELDKAQAKELSHYVFEQFREVCLENSIAGSGKFLLSDDRYEIYGESDIDGEAWVEDTQVPASHAVRITLRGGKNRCQIATWDDAHALYNPLVTLLNETMPAPMTAFREKEGNIREQLVFRRVKGEEIVFGEIIEVTIFDDGAVTILRSAPDQGVLVHDPRAQWRTEMAKVSGLGELPVAVVRMQTHRVRLYDTGGEHSLVFDPEFYEFFQGDRKYYMRQSNVEVDGVQLKAYGACVEDGENCKKNADWLRLSLGPASMEQIRKGEQLSFFVRTTTKEFMQLRFPLEGVNAALKRVAENEKVETLTSMRSLGDLEEQGRLMKAVVEGDLEAIKKLVEGGANPDRLVGKSEIPLVVLAGSEGQMEIARYLIAKGADIDLPYADYGAVKSPDPDMTSALHHAVRYSKGVEKTKLWLSLGADTEARNPDGRTPLMMVRDYQDNLDKFQALREAGAELHARDYKGRTAMHAFVRRLGGSHVDELAWLHREGLGLDVQDDDGNTPLMLAMRSYRMKEAEWLINEGADPWITNTKGQDALDVAVRTRNEVDDVMLWGPETKAHYKRQLKTLIDHFRSRQ